MKNEQVYCNFSAAEASTLCIYCLFSRKIKLHRLLKESAPKYLQFPMLHRSKGTTDNCHDPVKFNYLLIL